MCCAFNRADYVPALAAMNGFVTTRHLLTHSPTIIHEFGARCYVRCIWRTLTADRPVTFLECIDFAPLQRSRSSRAGSSGAPKG
jgi:hypothetical protein